MDLTAPNINDFFPEQGLEISADILAELKDLNFLFGKAERVSICKWKSVISSKIMPIMWTLHIQITTVHKNRYCYIVGGLIVTVRFNLILWPVLADEINLYLIIMCGC